MPVSPSLPSPSPQVLLGFFLVCVAFLFSCVFVTRSQWGDLVILAPGFGRGSRYNLCPPATILKPKFTSRQIADYRTYKWESQLLLWPWLLMLCGSAGHSWGWTIGWLSPFCWERQSDCVLCGMECQGAHLCSLSKPLWALTSLLCQPGVGGQASWLSIYPIFLLFLLLITFLCC